MGTLTIEQPITSEDMLKGQGPFATLFRECIEEAKTTGASDIHLEPKRNGLLVRHRLDGELHIWKSIPEDLKQSFTIETKRICKLSLAISNKPQDRRISLPYLGIDLRVNSKPTLFGEKIVLRLLDKSKLLQLSDSGFNEKTLSTLKSIIDTKNGVVLITGPTGSGKTSTLYSLLREVDSIKKSIATLEDPIEYTFEEISQSQATRQMSLAEGLRALLRQDPDVILVGEIRDSETAKLCFQAASTGHLVLSTLHTNGVKEVEDRLKNLGVDSLTFNSNIRFVGAQSLEKRLCDICKIKTESTYYLRNPKGCSKCRNGLNGRVPSLEFIDYSIKSDPIFYSRKDAVDSLIEGGICDKDTI